MRKFLASLATREMQIKKSLRIRLTLDRMGIIKNTNTHRKTSNSGEDVGKTPLWRLLKNLIKFEIQLNPGISLLRCLKTSSYSDTYSIPSLYLQKYNSQPRSPWTDK